MKNNSIESSILIHASLEDFAQLFYENSKTVFEKLKKELQNDNSDDLLSREQTCKFLQIDSSTLWSWTKKGKVTAYGIGNRRYYKKAELLNSLKPLKN